MTPAKTDVLVLGCESTGGHLMARLLGDDPELVVSQYSMPYGQGPDRHWPTEVELLAWERGQVIVTLRDWSPMLTSKIAHHEHDETIAELEVREALIRTFRWLDEQTFTDWRTVTFEALILHPEETMATVWRWLGRPARPLPEPVVDENLKWLEVQL